MFFSSKLAEVTHIIMKLQKEVLDLMAFMLHYILSDNPICGFYF